MAGWTMGVEAGNRQEGQPSQITFSQPTKFLTKFTVGCDNSTAAVSRNLELIFGKRALRPADRRVNFSRGWT